MKTIILTMIALLSLNLFAQGQKAAEQQEEVIEEPSDCRKLYHDCVAVLNLEVIRGAMACAAQYSTPDESWPCLAKHEKAHKNVVPSCEKILQDCGELPKE